jgi:WD40 repeat protein
VGEDRSVRLWHVETGYAVADFHGHAQYTYSVAWHPGGQLITSGGGDNAIKIWDVKKSRPIVKWHLGYPTGLAFDPSSDHRAIASQATLDATNGLYQLWDPTTGRSLNDTDLAFDPASAPSFGDVVRAQGIKPVEKWNIFSCVAFSRDGRLIAFRSGPDAIEVREKGKGTLIRRLKSEEGVMTIAFTSDGTGLVAGGYNGWFALWNLATDRREWIKFRGGERGLRRSGAVSAAISPDGLRLATSGGGTPLVLRDLTSGEIVSTLEDDPRLMYLRCAFDAKGTQLAVGCSDRDHHSGTVRVFDVASGRRLYELPGHTSHVFDVAFSPDGRRIASASGDRTIKLWDTARRKEVLTIRGHTQGVIRVAFSPDGNLLASSSFDWTVRIWDARPLP